MLLCPNSHNSVFKQLCGWGIAFMQKENRPLFAALGQGIALTSSLPSPSKIEGDGAPTRRSARITPGGVSGLLRTMRCTCMHLAPCGAPTRHLGLYAFDRG